MLWCNSTKKTERKTSVELWYINHRVQPNRHTNVISAFKKRHDKTKKQTKQNKKQTKQNKRKKKQFAIFFVELL